VPVQTRDARTTKMIAGLTKPSRQTSWLSFIASILRNLHTPLNAEGSLKLAAFGDCRTSSNYKFGFNWNSDLCFLYQVDEQTSSDLNAN
jgi:hypothetical protein